MSKGIHFLESMKFRKKNFTLPITLFFNVIFHLSPMDASAFAFRKTSTLSGTVAVICW